MRFYIKWALSTWFGLLYLRPFCPIWDEALIRLLDQYGESAELSSLGCFLVLGKAEVWIANPYYSYGYLWSLSLDQYRPGIRTMKRLDAVVRQAERLHKSRSLEAHKAKLRALMDFEPGKSNHP